MVPRTSGVYMLVNTITDQCYVGSSVDIERRKREHLTLLRKNRHHSLYLQHSFNLVGEVAFEWFVLEEVPPEKELLLERETHWIRVIEPDYNISTLASSRLGAKLTPEQLERHRQLCASEERRQSISKGLRNYWDSIPEEEYQKKCEKARNRPPISEDTRQRQRNAKLGKKQSPEFIQKRTATQIGKKRSEETRAKMRAAQQAKAAEYYAANPKPEKTYERSEEERQKMSDGMRASWARRKAGIEKQPGWQVDENGKRVFTEEHLQRLSEAQKRRGPRPFNEAHRQALSEAQKRRMERERQERLADPARFVLSEETKQKQRDAALRREAQKRAEREAKRSYQSQPIITNEPTQAPLFSAEELASIKQFSLFEFEFD